MKNLFFYALAVALIVGLSACGNNDDEIQTRDVEIETSVPTLPQTKNQALQLVADPEIRYVIVIPIGCWADIGPNGISWLMNRYLRPMFSASPNIRGNGRDGIQFQYGAISPADKQFLIQNQIPVTIAPQVLAEMKEKYQK